MLASKANIFNKLSILLLIVAASVTALPGAITKLSLLVAIILNIYFIGVTHNRILAILSILILLISSALVVGLKNSEPSLFVLAILTIWFISLPINRKYFMDIIRPSILLIFYLGFIASILTIFLGVGNFASSLLPKGLPYVYAFKGMTSTPQTYGTLGIIAYFCYTLFPSKENDSKFKKWLVIILGNFSLNRVTLVESFVLLFRNKITLLVVLSISIVIFFFLFSDNILFTVSTLESRAGLTAGIWNQYINGTTMEIFFGAFKQPEAFFHTSYTDINYIENGYMFLLYYFGVLGLTSYLVFFIYLLIFTPLTLKFKINKGLFFIAIIYFLIVPLLTHEFLSLSYYLMLYIVLIYYKMSYEKTSL